MISNGTLDDLYFEWLYGNVASVRNRNRSLSHWELAKQLYSKKFVWTVPNDDNREGDGKDLRYEFIDDCGIENATRLWLDLECSMFEMLLALARRASFESFGEPAEWFWKFLENLEIRQFTDKTYNRDVAQEVDVTLDRVINRTYKRNGVGGLFPLEKVNADQRKMELWGQLSTYLLQGGFVDHGP